MRRLGVIIWIPTIAGGTWGGFALGGALYQGAAPFVGAIAGAFVAQGVWMAVFGCAHGEPPFVRR